MDPFTQMCSCWVTNKIYNSSVWTQDVVLKNSWKWLKVETYGKRESEKSVLEAEHEDDIYIYIYKNPILIISYRFDSHYGKKGQTKPTIHTCYARVNFLNWWVGKVAKKIKSWYTSYYCDNIILTFVQVNCSALYSLILAKVQQQYWNFNQ